MSIRLVRVIFRCFWVAVAVAVAVAMAMAAAAVAALALVVAVAPMLRGSGGLTIAGW